MAFLLLTIIRRLDRSGKIDSIVSFLGSAQKIRLSLAKSMIKLTGYKRSESTIIIRPRPSISTRSIFGLIPTVPTSVKYINLKK